MSNLHLFILGLLLIGGMTSCSKENVDPDADPAVIQVNREDILNYANSIPLSGSLTTTGLYYVVTKATSSTATIPVAPTIGQELEFTYTLSTLTRSASNSAIVTATKVDSTNSVNSVFIPYFSGILKAGLEEGLLKMNEGDQAILLVPSNLAFGSVVSTSPPVPANSAVRYDVTLKRVRTEAQQISEYIAAKNLTVTEATSSGLQFIKTVTNSAGSVPASNQTLTIRATGRLLRASIPFDSTGSTITTALGKSLMSGFNEGLAKLRVGEKATLIFPSSIGYDKNGLGQNTIYVVPPYTPIRYDIELISAQ